MLVIETLGGNTEPEFITVRNSSAVSQNMTGWTIMSVIGPQTYTFPAGYVLEAGASVRVESWRGAINNPPAVLLWTDAAIWLNSGDAAELRNAGGTLVDTESYGSGCP